MSNPPSISRQNWFATARSGQSNCRAGIKSPCWCCSQKSSGAKPPEVLLPHHKACCLGTWVCVCDTEKAGLKDRNHTSKPNLFWSTMTSFLKQVLICLIRPTWHTIMITHWPLNKPTLCTGVLYSFYFIGLFSQCWEIFSHQSYLVRSFFFSCWQYL